MSQGDEPSADRPAESKRPHDRAVVASFFLPQYEQIPEEGQWWDAGFSEWPQLRSSRPFFSSHRQPQVPGSLGYYDLSDPTVHHRQHELAAKHGISAFCYYIYWFGGRRLKGQPIDALSRDQDLPLDYFFCWANENWNRSWNPLGDELWVGQHHDRHRDASLIDDVAPQLADDRYLKVDGRPLLLIYRGAALDDPMRTTDNLRERAAALGLGELHLGLVQSFGTWDPRPLGFDSAVEFPPHHQEDRLFRLSDDADEAPHILDPSVWAGQVFSYPRLIEWAMSKIVPDFTWFRGVMPAWDNTPRRLERASVFVDDSPELFQTWVERALHYTYLFNDPSRWLLFVNSWNEWRDGSNLEPDFELGSARLEALSAALANTDSLARSVRGVAEGDGRSAGDVVDVARAYFKSSAILGRETLERWASA